MICNFLYLMKNKKIVFLTIILILFIFPTTLNATSSSFVDKSDGDYKESIDYSTLIPLGRNTKTNLYWDVNGNVIYGKDGTSIIFDYYHPVDTIINGRLLVEDELGFLSSYIDTDSLYGSGILSIESIHPKKEVSYTLNSQGNNEIECKLSIEDVPIKTSYRKEILSYVSTSMFHLFEDIAEEDDIIKMYVPDKHTSVQDIIDYYAYEFYEYFGNEDEYIIYYYSFEKAAESDEFVTYNECYDIRKGWGSIWGYGTNNYITFDKHKGSVITLEDVMDMEYECILRDMLRQEMINKGAMNNYLMNVPIGNVSISRKGLVFSYEPWELTVPNDHIYNLIVDYENLHDFLKLKPKQIKNQSHRIVITKDDDFKYNKVFNSQKEIKKSLRKVDNLLPLSSLWDIGYGLENENKERLVEIRDSFILIGKKDVVGVINQKIGKKSFDYDLSKVALEKANKFISIKLWDMAIEHILIALANQPTPDEDGHDYYISVDSMPNHIHKFPNMEEEGEMGEYKYLDNIILLGDLSLKAGYKLNAIKYYRRAVSVLYYFLIKNFQESLPQKRGSFWQKYSNWYMNTLPEIAYKTQDDTLAVAAFNSALTGKGLRLNTERAERQTIYESKDTSLINLLYNEDQLKTDLVLLNDSIIRCTTIVNNLRKQVYNPNKPDDLEERIKSEEETFNFLLTERMHLSKMLHDTKDTIHNRIVSMGRFYHNYKNNISDIIEVLDDNDIAIEFVCNNDKINVTYYAMILKKGQHTPSIIRLFKKSELPNSEDVSQDLKKLYKLVWKPLEKHLSGINNVYFSPSGLLYDFSIEYAQTPSKQYMNEKYNMIRLSSTNEILLKKKGPQHNINNKKAAIFGGLLYDGEKGFHEKDFKRFPNTINDNSRSLCLNKELKHKHFIYLPGTKTEVTSITNLIKRSKLYDDVTLFIDTLGTENLFKSLSSKHLNLIHIATHGGIGDNYADSIVGFHYIGDIEDYELHMAYLAFAGANVESSNKSLTDGLVDGFEISSMNLSDLDLVVLSSCESGKGGISVEGVGGLQNAFKRAGVFTIMMSLRRVHDDATKILMTSFYENLAKGMNITGALSNAQIVLRKYHNGIYSNPYYWANFILLDAIN